MHAFLRTNIQICPYRILKDFKLCRPNIQCFCSYQIKNDDKRKNHHLYLNNTIYWRTNGLHVSKLRPYNLSSFINIREFSNSSIKYDKEPHKPSSKVEVTVQQLKKQQKTSEQLTTVDTQTQIVKKSLRQKIVDELLHYYHGFRLLFIDMKISAGLVSRVLHGKSLTRREYRLLTRTVGDMFRLVPFSVFIIVPFMEFLLPFFIKFFPGMLPSTFQTSKEKEDKIKQSLKVKLEMAKFLQETLDDMAVQHKDRNSKSAKEFVELFHKIRSSGEYVSNDDIIKFSKLFEDEITLDSLSRSQLIALCRVLEVQTLGTNNFLRFQLRMKLRSLAADDKMIQKEGIDSLTLAEVQQACRARGMRAYGLPEDRLRKQLSQWLDLSLNEKVPPSLLLLSRALMLPETIPTSDKLKATISALPECVVTQTTAAIGEKEGIIDNKVKLEVLKEEVRKINEERMEECKKVEQDKAKEKDVLIDKAPIISATSTPILEDTARKISVEKLEKVEKKEEHLQPKDVEIIESSIDTISKKKELIVEKCTIQELKAELADYQEDVEDLKEAVSCQSKPEIKESKAAQRLFKSVNKMINKLDKVMVELEEKEKHLKQNVEVNKQEILKIDDIMATIKQIKDVPDQNRIEQINNILKKMDADHDGSLKIEDVLKVIELIGKENVNLSSKQIDELIELLEKEEILEVEDKIEKALKKEKTLKRETKSPQSTISQQQQQSQSQNIIDKQKDGSDNTKNPPIIPPPSIDKTKPEGKTL